MADEEDGVERQKFMCALMSFSPLNESIRGMILEIAGKSVLRAGVDLLSSPLGETIQVFVCYANAHDELTPDIQEKGRLLAGVCKAMMKNTFLHQRVEWGLSLVMPIAYTSEARALLEGLIEEMTKCPTETTFEQIERFLSHLISLSEAPLISWGFYFSLLESAQKLVACMDAPPSGLMPHAKRIMTLITKIKKGGFKYDDRLIAFLNALLNKLSLSCVLNMNIPAWYREIRSINSGKILQFVVAKIAESELPIEDRYLRDYLDVLDTDMLPEMAQIIAKIQKKMPICWAHFFKNSIESRADALAFRKGVPPQAGSSLAQYLDILKRVLAKAFCEESFAFANECVVTGAADRRMTRRWEKSKKRMDVLESQVRTRDAHFEVEKNIEISRFTRVFNQKISKYSKTTEDLNGKDRQFFITYLQNLYLDYLKDVEKIRGEYLQIDADLEEEMGKNGFIKVTEPWYRTGRIKRIDEALLGAGTTFPVLLLPIVESYLGMHDSLADAPTPAPHKPKQMIVISPLS